MRVISGNELKDKIDRWEDLKLVFVLGEWQYRTKHIPGSLNLPCSSDLYKAKDSLEELDQDDEIVVYCSGEVCFASIAMYNLLVKRGYRNVSRYAGGLVDWENAGYPVDGEMAAAS